MIVSAYVVAGIAAGAVAIAQKVRKALKGGDHDSSH